MGHMDDANAPQWLQSALGELDGEVVRPTGADTAMDGFASVYRSLPEWGFVQSLNGDITVKTEDPDDDMHLRPVAMWGDGLVVRDLTPPVSNQPHSAHLYLRGSFYVPEIDTASFGGEAVAEVADGLITEGEKKVVRVESGIRAAYLPGVFCRAASLVISCAHSLESMRTAGFRKKTNRLPLIGTVITVPRASKMPLTLLIERDTVMSAPVRQVYWRLGGSILGALSYIEDDTA